MTSCNTESTYYKDYLYLSSNKVASENYKVIKLLNDNTGYMSSSTDMFYDKQNHNFLTRKNDSIYWKINGVNLELDSIIVRGDFDNSGVFFNKNYYVDWILTGDKKRKKYLKIIIDENFSNSELERLYEKAQEISFSRSYSKGRCYFKINESWLVVESEKLYSKIEYDSETKQLKMSDFPIKNKNRIIQLQSLDLFKKQENKPSLITYIHFLKKEKHGSSFFDFNNTTRAGWTGIGYFQLNHGLETLKFKDNTFVTLVDNDLIFDIGAYVENIDSFYTYKIAPYFSIYTIDNMTLLRLNKVYNDWSNKDRRGIYMVMNKKDSILNFKKNGSVKPITN